LIPFSEPEARSSSLPVVTLTIIGICCLILLYELVIGGLGVLFGRGSIDINVFFLKWGFIPDELTSGVALTGVRTGSGVLDIETPVPTWTTMFTSMFIHGGFFHIVFNMVFLWVFGGNLENRLGRFKFLALYLATGAVAALSHLAIDPGSQTPLVGASGGIAGVLGAYLLTFPYSQIRALIIVWFILQLFQWGLSMGLPSSVNIAFVAHIGGFVAGLILIAVYKTLNREPIWPSTTRRNPWDYWYRSNRR
jgi:membrane associated rhomboid family serine protease